MFNCCKKITHFFFAAFLLPFFGFKKEALHAFLARARKKVLRKLISPELAIRYNQLIFFLNKRKYSRHEGFDLVFIVDPESKGWILEGISKEIAKYCEGNYKFHYSLHNLPLAKRYYYSHYFLFYKCLQRNPVVFSGENYLYYTHPRDFAGVSKNTLVRTFNLASKIFVMCSYWIKDLQHLGVERKKLILAVGGASKDIFYSHERKGNIVGLCSAFYERKNPLLILELIKSCPQYQFLLIGKNWEKFQYIDELKSCTNFEYVSPPYSEYPKYYNEMSVFLSLSTLEGGPIPLIESMMANVFPVVTDTGFARDIVNHGENGYLLELDNLKADTVIEFIEKAMNKKTKVRETVLNFDWELFSKRIQKEMGMLDKGN